MSDYGIIYIQGPDGLFSNMDIDCDGVRQDPNNGRCGDNPTDQSTTSFRSRVQGYKVGLEDLDPYRHSFVVFGNSGTKPGYTNFAPMDHGIEPLSVMVAVTAESMVSAPDFDSWQLWYKRVPLSDKSLFRCAASGVTDKEASVTRLSSAKPPWPWESSSSGTT